MVVSETIERLSNISSKEIIGMWKQKLFYCTEYVGPRVGQDLHEELLIPDNVEITCGQKTNNMLVL